MRSKLRNSLSRHRYPIKVRRMDYAFGADIPQHWADGNPVLTAFMAAMSASFPPGELFFIESVRHYADRVTDPELKERIRGFVGQEANHTKEHLAFNAFLESRGYPIKRLEEQVGAAIRAMQGLSSPAFNLAQTAALEHLTAFFSAAILEQPEVVQGTHPTVESFWTWHAIEEIEHRSVAFDVYKQFVDNEPLRLSMMVVATALFSVANSARMIAILRKRGELFDRAAWSGAYDVLFGKIGIFRKALPLYVSYFRRDFHPDEHAIDDALEAAKRRVLGIAASAVAASV